MPSYYKVNVLINSTIKVTSLETEITIVIQLFNDETILLG